ncbi:YggT family protein [Caulobacter sp. KR2-114]|uniref:YggT family protein n=1 Tax=Caulobacter sp. KR2-114 TaxID=3400912 RepID=UPI003C09F31F
MASLLYFVFLVIHWLIGALVFVLIANAVISWLVAFEIINLRNRAAYQIVTFLDAVTRPILRPMRRLIPTLGGVDISAVILIILLEAIDQAFIVRQMIHYNSAY